MQKFPRLIAMLVLMLTSACSTVLEGRTQDISVDTVPSGASCLIKDNDIVLARVQTPAVATIEKSKNDILVECSKEGYATNKMRNRADMAISSIGNMVFGKLSVVGDMVDTASGAAHKYDSRVFMALNPLPPVARIEDAAQAAASAPDTAYQSADLSTLPPAQLTQELTRLLSSQSVVVTRQPPQEVIQQLMNGEPVKGVLQERSESETPPVMLVAQNNFTVLHQAE
jgi:hypothetical protein